MKLNVTKPLVDAEFLRQNIDASNLIVLKAVLQKVGTSDTNHKESYIPNSRIFDVKNVFSNNNAPFPNTIPSSIQFQREVQKLGINQDSCIIVYENDGIYASPRVWWMFQVFGFKNIAVLDGGFLAWQKLFFPEVSTLINSYLKGNFKISIDSNKISNTNNVLEAIKKGKNILDARAEGRFNATIPEPRPGLRGGHIPTSINLPYTELLVNGKMKTEVELQTLFSNYSSPSEPVIFSCGSGITACILALGASVVGIENYSVYDGSWTEWASNKDLPIES
ncbi:sulfurtransferase [Tenacibaculum sp. SG-28]|uniref:sulfurtransferase n=1 Tax=Tenacibaculum sp. SG-28 TaxID=754426 RepID=UPI000CF38AAE|nr:sulfurtransferase [Tenacibaculum sp. SG-28]PQJ23307.1 hypothetical protein BSU00_03655 [Tenacibaculum sp. SG-28]